MHFFLLNIYGFKPPRQKKNTFYVFLFFVSWLCSPITCIPVLPEAGYGWLNERVFPYDTLKSCSLHGEKILSSFCTSGFDIQID